jgi:hypothetical protein
LPPACGKAWLDAGVSAEEAYLKMFVPLSKDWHEREEHGEVTRAARQEGLAVLAFLRQRPEFALARVAATGRLGVRVGGRISGEYCLTEKDVRQGRHFADVAWRSYWPIEYWDAMHGVSLEYLPERTWYEIPLRALMV